MRGRGDAPRGDGDTVLEIAPYGGYGPDQTMHLMREVAPPGAAKAVRRGDELRISCVFNTSTRARSTRFGVNRGDEMCGPLLMYTPSDPNLPEKANTTCTAIRALTGGPRISPFLRPFLGRTQTNLVSAPQIPQAPTQNRKDRKGLFDRPPVRRSRKEPGHIR